MTFQRQKKPFCHEKPLETAVQKYEPGSRAQNVEEEKETSAFSVLYHP
jgi:hypothetical protein